jgi:hypothetical protein
VAIPKACPIRIKDLQRLVSNSGAPCHRADDRANEDRRTSGQEFTGDAIHALLCGAGHNLRLILAALMAVPAFVCCAPGVLLDATLRPARVPQLGNGGESGLFRADYQSDPHLSPLAINCPDGYLRMRRMADVLRLLVQCLILEGT